MNFEELGKKVKSKSHFYQALILNGRLLPKCDS